MYLRVSVLRVGPFHSFTASPKGYAEISVNCRLPVLPTFSFNSTSINGYPEVDFRQVSVCFPLAAFIESEGYSSLAPVHVRGTDRYSGY